MNLNEDSPINIMNWISLYIAIKHHDNLTVDEALLTAEGHSKLPPNKKISSLTTADIIMIIKKLSNPKFHDMNKLVRRLRIDKYSIIKVFLAYKEVNIKVDDITRQEQIKDVVERHKAGHSSIKIEEDIGVTVDRIFEILFKEKIFQRVNRDRVRKDKSYEEYLQEAIAKTKNVNKVLDSFEVNEIINIKLIPDDVRGKVVNKHCKIIFKNDNYITLVCLETQRKISVSVSDVIEKKVVISKVKEGSLT